MKINIFIFLEMDVTHQASLLGSIETDRRLGESSINKDTPVGDPAAPKAKTAGEPKTAGAAQTEVTKTEDVKPAASASKTGIIFNIITI